MVYITFFSFVTLLVYGVLTFGAEQKKRVHRRLSFFVKNEKAEEHIQVEEPQEGKISVFKRVVDLIFKQLKREFRKKMPGQKEEKLELKMLQAGNPFGMTPFEYRMLQIGLFLLLPILFGGYGKLIQLEGGGIFLLVLMGLATAIYLPQIYIKMKIKARFAQGLKELPDVLDLLTVSLEAGLGFDSAISKVVSKKEGVLSAEFHRCLEEIRLGKTRREALSGIRDRLAFDEMKTLISSILQAEKLGIGMVTVLRVQSNEVREQRKQRAEEEAMKAPIKMLFPLVLCIFPSLFIVLLGPAVIQFFQTFK